VRPLDRSELAAVAARVAVRALARPRPLARRGRALLYELAEIARGRSTRAPAPADRRFGDPAFAQHPAYRRLMQSYLALREALLAIVDEVELDEASRARGRFALTLVVEALAPTNTLAGNPAALKRAFDTGARSLGRGVVNLMRDLRHHGGLPSQVDRRAFSVGGNLAVSPGEVVFRNEVLELIQYAPATASVYERPLVMIPPQINKYYVLDLAPGRSLVEYAVRQGLQVFAVSWRNPTAAQRDWGLATYVRALVDATDAVREICGSERLGVLGACAGGITTAILCGHLAARGDQRVASATFPVTVLDTSVPSTIGLFASERSIARAMARARDRGLLPGRELARTFAWLRPNDLVWSYWVNNYLLGADPPAFDILYWNNDYTNLPATLYAEFCEIFISNSMCRPGAVAVLDTPIDLGRVQADVYAIGASTDHLTPWRACYRTPGLFGGERTFVESTNGHIQAIVNPVGNVKAGYVIGDGWEPDVERWLQRAHERKGSWWPHWAAWIAARSGGQRAAPARLGSDAHPPILPAPGRYVHQHA